MSGTVVDTNALWGTILKIRPPVLRDGIMSREPAAYEAAAERFLAVESALDATAASPAPVEGIVADVAVVSPAALPASVRRRLAEQASTHRLQAAVDDADTDQPPAHTPRTSRAAFPHPVVEGGTAADGADDEEPSTRWGDDLLSILPDQVVALTVVDPGVDMDLLPREAERADLAEAVGHQPVTTAFVFPDSTEITDQLGLPTLSGLFAVIDAESVTELNQRVVPLKPLCGSTAFVHTHENRELVGVDFAIERAAFEAGNITVEDGECRLDPELKTRLERTHRSQRTRNELVFGALLATVGSLPVVNLLVQSLTSSGLVSPLLFVVAVVCTALAVARMGSARRELESLATTPS